MGLIPDWVKNDGDFLDETLDNGLDHVKKHAQDILNEAKTVKEFMRENTWGISHEPVNTGPSTESASQTLKKVGKPVNDEIVSIMPKNQNHEV